jgi:UDPglucose--hexose-1-phosphate uridylyltransferase
VPDLRIDPLTGLRTIVAGDRADRPGGGFSVEPRPPLDPSTDPFLDGHEDRTPPEVYARRPSGGEPDTPGWTVRVVPNLYPALSEGDLADTEDPLARGRGEPDLFASRPAVGGHEVIVNAPQPVVALSDLEPAQLAGAMAVWRERMRAHAGAACRHLIVNERTAAGASLPHTHAQLFALAFVPAAIARERERFSAYAVRTMGSNLLGDLVQEEVRRRVRIVAIDDEAVLMAPWASQVPFQLMLAPRRTAARFEDDGPLGAALLHDALCRLRRLFGAPPPLNLWVRTAPQGAEHFCWRIDVLPRLGHRAGLELGAGVQLCTVAPEDAAAQLAEA